MTKQEAAAMKTAVGTLKAMVGVYITQHNSNLVSTATSDYKFNNGVKIDAVIGAYCHSLELLGNPVEIVTNEDGTKQLKEIVC